MEYILKKETCRDFLSNYHKEIYPILLPKIIEIGILTLKLSFNKVLFSPDEFNDIISSLNHQYNLTKQKKLNFKSNQKPSKNTYLNLSQEENQQNNYLKTISYKEKNNLKDRNLFCLNTTNISNFYDSNYFIPETKVFRNKQLYNKRLENPMFNTLNKDVYPFWWWNQTEPNYSINRKGDSFNEKKILKKFKGKNFDKKRNDNNKNYFTLKNKTNYKISYDRNFNVIKVETGKKKNEK